MVASTLQPKSPRSKTKRATSTQVNMRIPETQRELIDRAAESMGVTRTQFILDAARERAEDRLAERSIVELSPDAFDALKAMLDGPVVVPEGLRDLFARYPKWDALR